MTPRYSGNGWELYVGDCLAILPGLTGVDAVVTDPPYGIGFAAQPTKWSRVNESREREEWDNVVPDMTPVLRLNVPTMIWGGNHFDLPPSRGWIVWVKPDGLPTYGTAELCWTNLPMPVRHQYECWARPKPRLHPTQKPMAIMEWCLSFLPNAETILDPFAGSGTTGVACLRTGRKFIGIEIDPHYASIAAKRLQRAEADVRNSLPFPEPEPRPKQAELWEAV